MDSWIGKDGYETCLQATGEQLNASGTEIHLIRFQKGKFSHYHKSTTEFFHFTAGRGRVILNGREIPLHPGSSLLVQPLTVHTFINDSPETLLEAVMVKINTHALDTFVAASPDR